MGERIKDVERMVEEAVGKIGEAHRLLGKIYLESCREEHKVLALWLASLRESLERCLREIKWYSGTAVQGERE